MRESDLQSILAGLLVGFLITGGLMLSPRLGWAPPLIKMGVVNWEQVVMQYNRYQQALAELQQRRKRVLNFIDEEYREIPRSQRNPDTRNQELESMYEDTLKQIKERRERTIKEFHRNIYRAIEEEAIEQGYSLILSENEVLYASEEYTDLTHSVIERLNSGDTE